MCCQRGINLPSYLSKTCFKGKNFQEGKVYCHRIYVIYYMKKKIFDENFKREKFFVRESLVLKFHCAMTCCVAINAKEGDCWIQLSNCVLSLMLHKCHISCQSMLMSSLGQ